MKDKNGAISLEIKEADYIMNEHIYKIHNANQGKSKVCPDCGGEVIINKFSNNGFCIQCDYRIESNTIKIKEII